MAIDITIKQTGFFKKALTEADLTPAGLRMGHWNHAGVLDEGPDPGGRAVYDPAMPGRGCYVTAVPGEKEKAVLRQNLPCTPRDLEVFYRLVEGICKAWKTDRFEQDGAQCSLRDLPRLLEEQKGACPGLLRAAAQRWQEGDPFCLFTGAVYPIYLEAETVERLINGDVDFFAKYLSQKQTVDRYYAKPTFYRHNNGVDVLGIYSVTEGVDTILPLEPFAPPLYPLCLQDFDLKTEQVTQWQVGLTHVWEENGQLQGNTLGYVPFGRFAQWAKLEEQPRFDGKHVCIRFDNLSGVLE